MNPKSWLLAALIFVCATPSQAQSSASARQLVARGTSQMSRNKVDAAIESYTKAIALSPNYAEAYVRRGMARRAKGELNGSIEDYDRAAAIDPKSTKNNQYVAESFNNRGYNKLVALDVEGAIADFDRAVDIFPNHADHYHKRGQARLIKEDLQGAVADFGRALGMTAQGNRFARMLIHADRGKALLMQGKTAEAKRDFDACTKLDREGKFMLAEHLHYLEMRIMLMRRLRAEQRKGIT